MSKVTRQTRPYTEFDGKIAGFIKIHKLDIALVVSTILFIILVSVQEIFNGSPDNTIYALAQQLHYHLSRYSLFIAILMFVLSLYIGLAKHADVTPYYRRGVYVMVASMIVESIIGIFMYVVIGARPYEDVHLIYGVATILCLPFFIFVETTAEKRPSMGSYMWGFAILAGIIFRSISTGAP